MITGGGVLVGSGAAVTCIVAMVARDTVVNSVAVVVGGGGGNSVWVVVGAADVVVNGITGPAPAGGLVVFVGISVVSCGQIEES